MKLKINFICFDELSYESKDKFQKWFLEDSIKEYQKESKKDYELTEHDFIRHYYEESLTVDGDFVKIDGNRYYFYVGNIKNIYDTNLRYNEKDENVKHVIIFEDDEEVKEIITWYLEGREGKIKIGNTWDSFDEVYSGVAYRGGSGYKYALYAKEMYKLDEEDIVKNKEY